MKSQLEGSLQNKVFIKILKLYFILKTLNNGLKIHPSFSYSSNLQVWYIGNMIWSVCWGFRCWRIPFIIDCTSLGPKINVRTKQNKDLDDKSKLLY